ncbi:hypothetical protein T492DRAFT_1084581 [Pavlovales sp. CCMP2436]|nr:hypothetical protein T492DRAFT_1084581 [Pavlovales sp. CCMP2436]
MCASTHRCSLWLLHTHCPPQTRPQTRSQRRTGRGGRCYLRAPALLPTSCGRRKRRQDASTDTSPPTGPTRARLPWWWVSSSTRPSTRWTCSSTQAARGSGSCAWWRC